jgi:hypothetical protein
MAIQPEGQSRRNPGAVALSLMGWFELTLSVAFFAVGLPIVSMAFGLSGLGLGVLAEQAIKGRAAYRRSIGLDESEPGSAVPTRRGPVGVVLLVAAILLVPVAIYFTIAAQYMTAVILILWALILHMLSLRFRRAKA